MKKSDNYGAPYNTWGYDIVSSTLVLNNVVLDMLLCVLCDVNLNIKIILSPYNRLVGLISGDLCMRH